MTEYNTIQDMSNFKRKFRNNNPNTSKLLKQSRFNKWYNNTIETDRRHNEFINLLNSINLQLTEIKAENQQIKAENQQIKAELNILKLKNLYDHLLMCIADIANIYSPQNKNINKDINILKSNRNSNFHVFNIRLILDDAQDRKLIGFLYKIKNTDFTKLLSYPQYQDNTNLIINEINNKNDILTIINKHLLGNNQTNFNILNEFLNNKKNIPNDYENLYGYLYDVLK